MVEDSGIETWALTATTEKDQFSEPNISITSKEGEDDEELSSNNLEMKKIDAGGV